MNHDPIQDWSKLPWESTRPDVATGVLGSKVVPKGADIHTVTLTRVEPKGEFSVHADDYNHVFLFLEGRGEGRLGDDFYEIRPGLIVRVPAGQPHGYRNTNDSDLVLLTINYSDV
ncbi:MAG: cupin domain-containing protein [Candidatus Thorarchaeota archaeon]|jgi:quercetin dioxygenase-like cupin family protein